MADMKVDIIFVFLFTNFLGTFKIIRIFVYIPHKLNLKIKIY